MKSSELLARLEEKTTLIIDGATGTNLQQRGLPVGNAPENWVLTNPQEIIGLHNDFIKSGSDIILTCTFGGNRIRLAHAGLDSQAELINKTAVQLARQAVGNQEVLVAGSMGPTGEMMQPYGSLSEDDVYQIYLQQAGYLVAAGVDFLVVETQYDLNEALKAIEAIRSISDIALICSFSYDRGTRTMMGIKPSQVAAALNDTDVTAIGINCGKSLESNKLVLEELSGITPKPIWYKPNAGSPETDAEGNVHYRITPQQIGSQAVDWIKSGARFIGGCCGTSPELLASIAKVVK